MVRPSLSRGESRAPRPDPQCEALFEIGDGKLGRIEIGRLLKGNDAGRLVVLRTLSGEPTPELTSAIDLARSLAHPRLAKVLGLVRDSDTWYIASEYIAGTSLVELSNCVSERGAELSPRVALRIVLDALGAAAEAQRLLGETANLHEVRCVYPESIWIAEFGEVFLTELLIAPLLAESVPSSEAPAQTSAAALDTRAAAAGLQRLLEAPGVELPAALRAFVDNATSADPSHSYADREQAIQALSALGADQIATEQEVSSELQRVMGLALDRRRQKVEMLECFAPDPREDEATRFFRLPLKQEQSDTTRPPPAPPSNAGPVAAIVRSAEADGQRTEPPPPSDDATALHQTTGNAAPVNPTPHSPVPAPARVGAPALDTEQLGNPISAVWRQARDLLDSPARGAKQRLLHIPVESKAPAPARAPAAAPAAANPQPMRRGTRRTRIAATTAALAIALLLALAALARSRGQNSNHQAPAVPAHHASSGG